VTSAGAIFLGPWTPTAFGDYVAGSNHVLPTGGSARFASPLGVDTFMRASSLIELGPASVASLAPPLACLAKSEGFAFHGVSALLRSDATQAS
jgi:histidinol dehydrogenase